MWKLSRFAGIDDYNVPRYTGWISQVSAELPDSNEKTVVTYLPPIHHPITNYETVIEFLKQMQGFASNANMNFVHLTLDVGAAAKSYQTIWNFPDIFANVVVHLGDFHLMQENFSIIGQLVRDSGFEDIVFQAGLCASGSLNGILSGKHYNRAWNVHEHFADALERLLLQTFIESTSANLPEVLVTVIKADPKPTDFKALVDNAEAIVFFEKYNSFRSEIRNGKYGKTSQFWLLYLDMVERQHLHAAIKENDYDTRMLAWKNSLPLFFAFNKHNYARYGSYYVQTLKTLNCVNPIAKKEIVEKGLSVRRSNSGASRQAIDQAGEQTYNRNAKVPGGIKLFAGNSCAYERWVINRPHITQLKEGMLELTGLQSSQKDPTKSCRKSEIRKSKERVQNLLGVLKEEFVNPFSNDLDKSKLFNLSSGAPVDTSIADSILTSVERGCKRADEFVQQRLEDNQINFFAPIKKEKLLTFQASNKRAKCSTKGKVKELKIERDILGKLLALSLKNDASFDMYCLGPVPLSIAHPDGTRRKTAKSKLLEILVEKCDLIDSTHLPPRNSVMSYVIDLLATVRLTTDIPTTFEELAKQVLKFLPSGYHRIDVIADTYKERSIKDSERNERGSSDQYMITGPKTKVPRNFTKFLENGQNKQRLIDLILQVWEVNHNTLLRDSQTIYFSKQDICIVLTKDAVVPCEELCSDQEEADTKIALHVQHALKDSSGPVIMRSPSGDTDILVILLSLFRANDNNFYIDNGHGNSRKILQINNCKLPIDVQSALVGFHLFTGNDYVSSFFRKGKTMCYSLMTKDKKYLDAFMSLGSQWDVEETTVSILEQYICSLYGRKKCDSVNVARQQIFWERYNKSKQIVDLSLLPPCRESLVLHIRRANYVSRLWRLSLVPLVNPPHPSQHGWNSDLSILWTSVPFPDDILPLLINSDENEEQCSNTDDELADDDEPND